MVVKAGFICQFSKGLNAKLLKLVNEQKQLSQDHLKIPKKKKKNYTSNETKADYMGLQNFGKKKQKTGGFGALFLNLMLVFAYQLPILSNFSSNL